MGAIISGLANILGGINTSNAYGMAGSAITGAATKASQAIGTAGNQAAAATNLATGQGVTGIQNAVTSGTQGVQQAVGQANTVAGNLLGGQLQALNPYYGVGTTGTSMEQTLAQGGPAAAAALAQTPGYQFQLQQGLQGVQQQLAAQGGAATGGALKALTQYGQGLAQNYYQNAFNNAATMTGQGLQGASLGQQASENYGNTYNTNTMGGAYYTGNLGLQGATSAGNLGLQGAVTAGNQNMQGTNLADQYTMQGAQGAAAGILGSAAGQNETLGGMGTTIGGLANMALNMPQLQNLFTAQAA